MDGIPAELLVAGGAATAVRYSEVNARVLKCLSWPTQWRGGRMVPVYKRKGDPQECDNSRGILLADHASKALAGAVKRAVDAPYSAHMPECQHGVVAGKGTEVASHLIRTAIDVAKLQRLSVFVLFIDLVKAFDRVIRQLVLGWGDRPPGDPAAALEALGASPRAAAWIAQYIQDHGHLFKQWGVDQGAAGLARALHVRGRRRRLCWAAG